MSILRAEGVHRVVMPFPSAEGGDGVLMSIPSAGGVHRVLAHEARGLQGAAECGSLREYEQEVPPFTEPRGLRPNPAQPK